MSDDAFLRAVAGGDAEAVSERLAREPVLAGARDERGLSALLLAVYNRHEAVRAALLAARPPLDVLELAALGDVDALRGVLATDPAAVAARSADGFTPLHYAAFFGGPAAVGALLEAGADVDAVAENDMRVRPLHSAAAVGDRAVVEALLQAGAEPNSVQQGGFTPLHAAAQNDDADLARLLLDHGADPSVAADDGRDARAFAGERVAALLP